MKVVGSQDYPLLFSRQDLRQLIMAWFPLTLTCRPQDVRRESWYIFVRYHQLEEKVAMGMSMAVAIGFPCRKLFLQFNTCILA